ncbi:ORF6N domain-containing protein [Salmonella enterica]|nr:ORF6N domain-containing protein [Salmonella enterica]EBD7602515.1 ORF6N domain-containing protein [Salmonella enterica]
MNTVTINNKQLPAVEYRGQRVVTFAMIDNVHGRPDGTAKRNFEENRHRFIEGVDFFELSTEEIRTNLPEGTFSKFAPRGITLAERYTLVSPKDGVISGAGMGSLNR